MVNELFELIKRQENVRQNLSKLRQEIKDSNCKKKALVYVQDAPQLLIPLLHHEDAKTRKNTALLMGDLGFSDFLAPLYAAYEAEEQLFVKSSYLTALQAFDYTSYLPLLQERLALLTEIPLTTENKKHLQEEMHLLSGMIVAADGLKLHTFRGFKQPFTCILLTNRLHASVTQDQITYGQVQPFIAGVQVTSDSLEEILEIRTYSEQLFLIPGMHSCSMDALAAADKIAKSELVKILMESHTEKTPFYFRVDLKSRMPLDKKSVFAKKFSHELERLTKRQLINSTSNYEFEIRMIENKGGTFNLLLKLYTIPDHRFDYRKEYVAASIKPVNAALLVALARNYMKEDAQVLDPFCGVGTMLIERQKIVKANTSYGIDLLEEAIVKAKLNTRDANQLIHYINRNFFDFEHEYLFDEIFTNMPFAIGRKTQEEIYDTYIKFFRKAKELLTQDGTIIMYSHDKDYVLELAPKAGYHLVKQFEIMDREETYLFILR